MNYSSSQSIDFLGLSIDLSINKSSNETINHKKIDQLQTDQLIDRLVD